MVLAILSFVGFESAATLGDEAKRPLQTIPRAIVGSTILSGLFFVGIAYLVVLGFGNLSVSLAQSDAPISVLADRSRVGWIGTAVAIGVMIAGFAATIAGINATARIVFSLAQQRMIPGWLGRTHAQNHTPHRAILSVSTIVFFFCSVLLQSGIRPLDILAYSGTLLSNGFLIIYLVIALSAPVYLRRLGQLRVKDLLISGLGVIAMLVPLASSLYPIPPAPYDSFPYLLMLWLVVGLGCWRFRRKNND